MGRELQKRKNRSSRPKSRPKILGRTKAGKKKVNFLRNETIAQNWDRDLTLSQNYTRLGLSTKLNSSINGPRRIKGKAAAAQTRHKQDSLAITPSAQPQLPAPQEVRVERDPETGRITRVIRPSDKSEDSNPLADPLNDLSDDEDGENVALNALKSDHNIVAQLQAQADKEMEIEAKRKKPRSQSSREEEWIARLIEVHGDDVRAMSRDRKLNSMQQSEGDIARRVKKWKVKHGG